MGTQPTELRTMLAWMVGIVALFASIVAVALVILATRIDDEVARLGNALESVRVTQEAEIDLMLHERGDDPLVNRGLEAEMQRRLHTAEAFAESADESEMLTLAEQRVDEYIAASHDHALDEDSVTQRHEAAYAALEALVQLNVARSRDARRAADRSDDVAQAIGVSAATLLLGATALVLWWLKTRAFAPVFDLSQAMERFGRGDRAARAEERGPGELREMARRFNEMATAIADHRQAQVAFLAGVAHDLRNPLNALQLSASLLKSDTPPPDLLVRRTAEIMSRQIGRLDRMVGDLIDTTRIEAGELRLVIDERDLKTNISDVVQLFEATAPHHVLELDLPAEPVLFRCDHGRIDQVVTNLLSNAIKYSPFGGPISISLAREGDAIVIAVKDQGLGMSTQDQQRIFEPFRRVGTAKDTIPGAGLGLYVVRRIVAAHGGHIDVESGLGHGSTFRVVLPVRKADDAAVRPHPAEEQHLH